MDTFRGTDAGGAGRLLTSPGLLMTVLVVLVIIILFVMLFNMSSQGNSSDSGGNAAPNNALFNPLNANLRNNPVVTTATTTRAL